MVGTPKTEPRSATASADSPLAFGAAAMEAWIDMGVDAVRFLWDRLQQDIKTQQALLACTSLDQMQKIQADFFGAAQEQYAAQAGKMLEMMVKASGTGASATARKYDDVPL